MRIAVLGAGHIGSTVGRLWHAAGHEVTFAARDATAPQAVAEELSERAHAATVAEAVAAAEVVLVALPGPAGVDVLTAAGSLDGQVVIDVANMMGTAGSRSGSSPTPSRGHAGCAPSTQSRHASCQREPPPAPLGAFLSGGSRSAAPRRRPLRLPRCRVPCSW